MVAEKTQKCNPDSVFGFIKKFVPDAEKESNVGAELSFRLPHDAVANFPRKHTYTWLARHIISTFYVLTNQSSHQHTIH